MKLLSSKNIVATTAVAASAGVVVFPSTLLGVSAAEPVCQPTKLTQYDFIVVGGGTTGSTAAAELARNLPNHTVLLLDQGKDFSDQSIVMNNDEFADAQESPYCEHMFSTEPALAGNSGISSNRHVYTNSGISSDRNIYACSSKILGGSSSLNYGGWYRAPESDLNEWVEATGDDSWSYDNLLPYFKRLEAVQRAPGTLPNPDRGYEGLIPVRHENISVVHYHTGMIAAIGRYLGVPVGDQDSNNRYQDAVGSLQESRVEDGCWYDEDGLELGCAENLRRGSSYVEFIRDPQRRGEIPNLHILEGAKVMQVFDYTPDNEDGPMTVEYVYKSYRYRIQANQEILLSAGTWANPKIALLSGMGNATELDEVGIETQINLPGVGRDFKDHAVLRLTAMLNNIQTANITDVNFPTEGMSFDPNTFSGTNNPLPALLSGRNAINLFFKSNASLAFPDMELLVGLAPAGPTTGMLMLRIYQNRGASGFSGGHLKLRSDDPSEEMDSSRNWYADDESIQPMLDSLKTVLQMINTGLAQSAPMLLEPNALAVDINDDEDLKSFIRSTVISANLLQGSMKMGTPADPLAVVDTELKVIGSNGRLRVADTSIFPTQLRGHPMVMAMTTGMRAATMIAETHAGSLGGIDGGSPTTPFDDGVTGESDVERTEDSGSASQCAFVVATAATTCAFAAIAGY